MFSYLGLDRRLACAYTLSAMQLIDGKAVSARVLKECKAQVDELVLQGCRPGLAVVLVGDDAASRAYVRSKERACKDLGIYSVKLELPFETTQEQLQKVIVSLNEDPDVDGILVQSPPPKHIDERAVVLVMDPAKDVDGFHPRNVGRLWSGEPGLVPATPLGLIRILDHFCIPIEGQHVVIIGRSNLVGKPAAALFLHRHATVTLAHSKTRDLPLLTRQADILVAGAGRAGIVTKEWVKDGATILDVGQSLVGGNILGDVDPAVAEVAAAMTPTPGGTGPMTVAMVIHNTVEAARSRRAAID